MAALVVSFMFVLLSFATAAVDDSPFTCDDCVKSKAGFYRSNTALSSGACGYGSLALNLYGAHIAGAVPSIYKDGAGCGACFQIRCKRSGLCSKSGTTMVVTDYNNDQSNTTDFVMSKKAFRAMALPGKDKEVLKLGVVDVEYKRIPCNYRRQNLAFRVEEFSKFPNYLAIKVLYQGGQTEILIAELGSVGQVDSPNWKSMSHNYGAVYDTGNAPTGPLQFRFVIKSGFDAQYFYTEQVLPTNWKNGVIYTSTVQIDNVAAHGCNPCGPWK